MDEPTKYYVTFKKATIEKNYYLIPCLWVSKTGQLIKICGDRK